MSQEEIINQILEQLPDDKKRDFLNLLKMEEKGSEMALLEEVQGLKEGVEAQTEQGKATCDEICALHETLKEMKEKEAVAPIVNIEAPQPVVVPAPKVEVKQEKIDMSETNNLLREILEKEGTEEITIELELV
jgi:hypothetical protein